MRNLYRSILLLAVAVCLSGSAVGQDKKKSITKGTPVLWEKTNIATYDTLLGPGGHSMKPDISKVTFVKEETGGHSKKYRITDATGRTWVAKLGDEAQSETAAVRILSALGYKTDINYLVPTLTIPGKGTFQNVRLEARPDGIKRGDTWSWRDNPFKGTREFQGLKIMMAFLNNWDMKQDNNVILLQDGKAYYAISDLGVSFGKTGNKGLPIFWRIGRSRNVPEEYAEAEFVTGVKSGKISFNFNGKNDGSLGDIKIEDGRWLSKLLRQLKHKQIEDAFRAANYSDSDVTLLTGAVKNRIRALELATHGTVGKN